MDVIGVDCYNLCETGDIGRTLATSSGGLNEHIPVIVYAIDQQGGKGGANYVKDIMPTLCSDSHGTPHGICYAIENHPNDSRAKIDPDGITQTLSSRMGTGGNNTPFVLICEGQQKKQRKYVIRRITPTEGARLQGFPDWWCDGADGSDSAMYKMWGNGIGLPCAYSIMKKLAKAMKGEQEDG